MPSEKEPDDSNIYGSPDDTEPGTASDSGFVSAQSLSIDEQERIAQEKLKSILKQNPHLEQEAAHVLFMDIVSFSLLTNEQQRGIFDDLQEIVRAVIKEHVPRLRSNQLIRLPTGDGMALVFFTKSPVAAVKFAQQISSAFRDKHPQVKVRMGIHTGPVYRFKDINGKRNVIGGGINMAQRVMDAGDGSCILLTKGVAEFLLPSEEWKNKIRDLGKVKVKHGLSVRVFSLCDETTDSTRLPSKIKSQRRWKLARVGIIALTSCLLTIGVILLVYYLSTRMFGHRKLESLLIVRIDNNADSTTLTNGLFNAIGKELYDGVDGLSVKPEPELGADINLTSVENAIEMARRQGVQGILYGSMKQAGGIYTLTINLVDVRTGHFILKDRPYQKQYSNIGEIPDLIAHDVAKTLRGKDLPTHPSTASSEAFMLYLEGRELLKKRTGDDIKKSIEKFEAATKADSKYADAYAALAEAYNVITGYTDMSPKEAYGKAESYARQAINANPNLPEAHVALAYCKANFYWDWKTAEEEFTRARTINSKSALYKYSYAFNYLIPQGRMAEAISLMNEAADAATADGDLIIPTNLGWTYYYAGDYPKAIKQYEKVLETNPAFPRARRRLREAYEQTGQYNEAISEWYKWADLPSNEKKKAFWMDVATKLDKAYGKSQKPADYWQTLLKLMLDNKQALQESVTYYEIASVYAMLGDDEAALGSLEKAIDVKDDGLIKLAVNPRFKSLKDNPKFQDYINRIQLKLPEANGAQ
ncbi:MAG: tetratricopeptide repeat protein [Pyrinomonadaceae bacterium]|nr:tetratricopeptide repeat protein [Pyrinomonadaceae bacterium]